MAKKSTDQWIRAERVREFNAKADFFVEKAGLREVTIPEYFRLLFDRFGQTYLQEFKHVPAKAIVPDGWCCALAKYFVDHNDRTDKVWSKEHPRTFIVTREYERTTVLQGRSDCFTSPLVYIGNRRSGVNARAFFAFVFDIDQVTTKGLDFFYRAVREGRAPRPSMVVSSGSGVHLYYILKNPIKLDEDYSGPKAPMKPDEYRTGPLLDYLKRALTTMLWNMCSDSPDVQSLGIYQGYRIPGTRPKSEYGISEYVKGYVDALGDIPYYTCSDLNRYLLGKRAADADPPLNARQIGKLDSSIYDPTKDKTPLEEAKKQWPEWTVKKKKKVNISYAVQQIRNEAAAADSNSTGTTIWTVNTALYDWWLSVLRETTANKVRVGHRYHCIQALAVFASKCKVPFSKLRKDAQSLYAYMESLTVDPGNHFRRDEIDKALTTYHNAWSHVYRRDTLSRLTGIDMPANKRNKRKQALHLKIARQTQAILVENSGKDWREGNGAHSKQDMVFWWRQANPLHDDDGLLIGRNHDKSRCARECTYIGRRNLPPENGKKKWERVEKHLSRMTVDKWWNALPADMDGVGYTEYVTWLLNDDGLTPERRADLWEKRPAGPGKNAKANAACEQVEREIEHRKKAGRTVPEDDDRWLPGMIARMARKGMTGDEIIKDLFG